MRVQRLSLILVLLLLAVPAWAAENRAGASAEGVIQEGVPPILYANVKPWNDTYPVWVSGDAAIDADGNLEESLFHPAHRLLWGKRLEAAKKAGGEGCVEIGRIESAWVNPPDQSTIEQAVETSELVLLAEVIHTEGGFGAGEPGTLHVVRALRAFKGVAPRETYYFFMPKGVFAAGPYTICKVDEGVADLPQVGDQVVLFVPRVVDPEEAFLRTPYDTGVIVLGSEGPSLPDPIRGRADAPSSNAEVLDTIRTASRRPNGKLGPAPRSPR